MQGVCKKRYGLDMPADYPNASKFLDTMRDHMHHFSLGLKPKEVGGTLDTTLMHGDPRIENFFVISSISSSAFRLIGEGDEWTVH